MENVVQMFRNVVGADNFFEAPEVLEAYSKDHSFVPPRKPLAVLKARNTDEIKEVIDLANETLMPIIPTSSGFPKFHGDTIPRIPGIVLDLSGLDQVLRVDRRNKIAIIEPGVTFGRLRKALEEEDMVPYMTLLPRSTKSVLSSALEREPITIPKDHWDFNDPLGGGELIIGDGYVQGVGDTAGRSKEEVQTGEAIPVMPLGPGNVGWLNIIQGAQGSLGIVRWASIRCRIKPSIQRPFFITADDLKILLPFMHKMLRLRFVEELFILNDFGLANILAEEADEIKETRTALPAWVVFVNIAGYKRYAEKELEWKEKQLGEAASEQGLELRDALNGVSSAVLLRILEKTADKDRRIRFKNSCQVLPFSATLDRTAELVAAAARTAADYGYPSADLGIYIQPVLQGCQCECEICYPYDSENELEAKTVKNLFAVSAENLANLKAYYSRPYGILADITYKDKQALSLYLKTKGILDPNDIMSSAKFI